MSRREVSDLDCGAKATMVVVPPATADLVPYLKLSTVYSMEVVPVCTSFEVI